MVVSKALYYSVVDIGIADLRVVDPLMLTFTSEQERSYHALQEWCQSNSVLLCTADDEQYHFKFRQVYSPPYVLTMIGDSELLHRELLAVVGPRRVSSYGVQVVDQLFSSAQHYDLATISGLADGVDMLCHQHSLDAHIPTIAVLGFGLRWALRSPHREMIHRIIDAGGLVISEFQLDQGPQRYTFPQRNRIVAGLSNMVFVPEAAHKSGSLITIDFAQKMHKEVYGTPGSIFSDTFSGLGAYMQSGIVKPVIDMDRMFDRHFGRRIGDSHKVASQEVVDNPVVLYLQKNPVGHSVNELAYQTGLDIEEIMSHLTMAEVLGQISQRDGKRYYK